jgi:hypothetical protein
MLVEASATAKDLWNWDRCVLGNIFHDSNLIFDLFVASDYPAKGSEANKDAMSIFISDSVTYIKSAIRKP